jgi:serine/threonine protein kinase
VATTSPFEPEWKKLWASLVSWLIDGFWPRPAQSEDPLDGIRGYERGYFLQQLIAVGDVADIHLGSGGTGSGAGELYLLKVSRVPQGNALLTNERMTLAKLLTAAGETTYRKYLPTLVESFSLTGKVPRRVNAFRYQPGFHTLEQVHEQHASIDGRHLAWIFKRLLTVLGFSHRQHIIHGAVLPCQVMINAADHGLQLIGWGQSVREGQRLSSISDQYADWYPPEVWKKQPLGPATDLLLAARCLVYLAGGNPLANRIPDSVPTSMQQFIQSCLFESPRMRPDNAWALLDEFDDLLRQLYGAPKFHELVLV